MRIKRRIIRVASVLAVALAAGHLVQASKDLSPVVVADASIPGVVKTMIEPQKSGLPISAALTGTDPQFINDADVAEITSVSGLTDSTEGSVDLEDGCRAVLDLVPAPLATLEVKLTAPCSAGQRVVLRHSGLTFTARIPQDGIYTVLLPALETEALVSVFFPNSEVAIASVVVPDADQVQRFGLQWISVDTIDLNVKENGQRIAPEGLMRFGDPDLSEPMFAEIYTYPDDPDAKVDVQVEVKVTAETCGRDIFAETITTQSGRIDLGDLKVNLPACDGSGDILVLKNLAPDMKIAAAN